MRQRKGPGLLSRGDVSLRYFAMRMALIRAEKDHAVAMRMLADLALWNAVTQQRRRSYRNVVDAITATRPTVKVTHTTRYGPA